MQKNKKCKCGSSKVVFVITTGRSKKLEAFCEKCLPVEPQQDENEQPALDGKPVK